MYKEMYVYFCYHLQEDESVESLGAGQWAVLKHLEREGRCVANLSIIEKTGLALEQSQDQGSHFGGRDTCLPSGVVKSAE
jgi:hypothetical protein